MEAFASILQAMMDRYNNHTKISFLGLLEAVRGSKLVWEKVIADPRHENLHLPSWTLVNNTIIAWMTHRQNFVEILLSCQQNPRASHASERGAHIVLGSACTGKVGDWQSTCNHSSAIGRWERDAVSILPHLHSVIMHMDVWRIPCSPV